MGASATNKVKVRKGPITLLSGTGGGHIPSIVGGKPDLQETNEESTIVKDGPF